MLFILPDFISNLQLIMALTAWGQNASAGHLLPCLNKQESFIDFDWCNVIYISVKVVFPVLGRRTDLLLKERGCSSAATKCSPVVLVRNLPDLSFVPWTLTIVSICHYFLLTLTAKFRVIAYLVASTKDRWPLSSLKVFTTLTNTQLNLINETRGTDHRSYKNHSFVTQVVVEVEGQ